jgi:DNA helicase-2/ATP-dependent DNA helicase PcrA
VALFSNSDTAEQAGKVKLMTVHSAKGLEFPYVFLCGMNEGIFPSRKVKTLPGMEEERRLAFVAVTRARKGLYLSESEGRNLDGSARYPSRFILDMDQALLDYVIPPREELLQETRKYVELSDLRLRAEDSPNIFSAGQRVVHALFGVGTVVEADLVKKSHIIQFDQMDTPRAISFRARLQAIEAVQEGDPHSQSG